MEVDIFVPSVEAFQFSKFYENDAKHGKRNFKRSLSVVFVAFEHGIKIAEKVGLKFLKYK